MAGLLQFLALISFFVVYKMQDIFWATGVALFFYGLHIAYAHFKGIATKLDYISFALFALLGVITIAFQDEAFIQWKLTIISLGFGFAMYIALYVFKKNLMKSFFDFTIENINKQNKSNASFYLTDRDYSVLNHTWAMSFIIKGIANHYVVVNYSLDQWVTFKTFAIPIFSVFVLLFTMVKAFKGFQEEPQASE